MPIQKAVALLKRLIIKAIQMALALLAINRTLSKQMAVYAFCIVQKGEERSQRPLKLLT
jgi:hypothetical protein